jgi:hypothetical protein
MNGSRPPTERQLLNDAVDLIRDRLPAGWTLTPPVNGTGPRMADASGELSAPDGRKVRIEIEVKGGAISGREATALADDLSSRAGVAQAVPLLIARYLSPAVRERLQVVGVSYADTTGNIMLSAVNPGIYLADRGGNSDPFRAAGRPRGTLKGDPAARVVRALLDYARPWRVRDLIATSGASTGATYRVLEYLDEEGLADRGEDGAWTVPDWERLLRAWSRDYNFLADNTVTRYIDPRGIDHFLATLSTSTQRYALTGAAAAGEWSSVAPTRSVFVYAESPDSDAASWGLRRAESGINVVLLEPRSSDSMVFANVGALATGVVRAAPAQVAVDLLNGPGRDPSEGEELLVWMKRNERAWRSL